MTCQVYMMFNAESYNQTNLKEDKILKKLEEANKQKD